MGKNDVASLAININAILADYANAADMTIERAKGLAAKAGLESLKKSKAFADRTGKYRASFAVKKVGSARIVYSSGVNARISHLIEHGHAKIDGGRVEGRSHWAPAEEEAINVFEREVRKGL